MQFRIGNKISVIAPSWREKCVVSKMGFDPKVMYVRRADGCQPAIFKGWASIIRPKNQQLLFEFME